MEKALSEARHLRKNAIKETLSDALDTAMGAVFKQYYDKTWKPQGFLRRRLGTILMTAKFKRFTAA